MIIMRSFTRTDQIAVMRQSAAARDRRARAYERRRALSQALHCEPLPLAERLAHLRHEADAYRTQAILLNAKLAMFEHQSELREMREQLVDSSARVDSAVHEIVECCTRPDS